MKASDFKDSSRFESLGTIDLFDGLSAEDVARFTKRLKAAPKGSQESLDVMNELSEKQRERENVFYECAACETMSFDAICKARPDIPMGQAMAALKDEGWVLMTSRAGMLKKCEAHA